MRRLKYLFFGIALSGIVLGSCDDDDKSQEITLKPGAAEGKDAQVFSGDPTGNEDLGTNRRDLVAYEWINNSIPSTKYILIDFDLSFLETNAVIEKAEIWLYHDEGSFDEGHSQLSGPNDIIVERIISDWEESGSWNERPTTTSINFASEPASTSETQNYQILVTRMVRDYVADPDNSYGFRIRMADSNPSRSVTFASSDHPDANLHPEIRITYR